MPAWAMMEPIFPDAAEMPCEVERYRVGKHSPGTMKVVAFGPVRPIRSKYKGW
jgi:hypothetical protein